MNQLLLIVVVAVLYVLHQDFWFWREARPLVFGFLPIGLAYHALYCVAVSALMWMLTRVAWPAHLEDATPGSTPSRRSATREGGPR